MAVMPTRPMKLQIAAMAMARPAGIARVPTTVAMALGASVAPFTMVAPMHNTTITPSIGLAAMAARTLDRSTAISASLQIPYTDNYKDVRRAQSACNAFAKLV